MAIYYEDIETELVAFFTERLGGVRVATKKSPADAERPSSEVVVTVTPARDKEVVTRFAGVVLDIYTDDYASASYVSRLVEMHLREATECRSVVKVDIIAGPTRLPEESTQEKRSISAEFVLRAFTD